MQFPYLRRFSGHLDSSLEYRDGEIRVRWGRQPQSELRPRLLHLQLFYKLVQLWHPWQWQVTVGQENPFALLNTLLDHPRGYRCLSLTQGQSVESVCHTAGLSQLQQGTGGVLVVGRTKWKSTVFVLSKNLLKWRSDYEYKIFFISLALIGTESTLLKNHKKDNAKN